MHIVLHLCIYIGMTINNLKIIVHMTKYIAVNYTVDKSSVIIRRKHLYIA